MRLTRFCLGNPIAVTLFYIVVALLGFTGLLRMGRSILPPVSLPVVTIAAPYPGAGPKELERLVIEPIEDQLDALPDLDRVSASAQNGIAQFTVQFRFGSNVETDRTNVAQAVNAAQANMPPDLVAPTVSKDDPTQAPILEESVGSGVLSPGELAEILNRDVVPALRATKGVGSVGVSGELTQQFTIRPKAGALDALSLTSLDVFRAVSGGNSILPGGVLKSPLLESTIGINAAATSVDSLENLPLQGGANASVRLRDVAAVEDGYADQTTISRVDGDPSIIVSVSHAQGEDSLRTIRAVRSTFARFSARYPLVRFEELRSDAPYTNASVEGVLQTLGEGIVLTVLVMLVFLHAWRNALISAIAIPASLCAAFATMWALGFTINVLSLMGLSLTIGILVDDSIVIIEAITTNARRGLQGDDAALAGRKELGGAAIAITLVDVAVFAPIALMSGVVGEFMREFGLVIVFATAFSLLVSFTLTPLLAARWALRRERDGVEGLSRSQIFALLLAKSRTFPWTYRTTFALGVLARWHAAINAWNSWEARMSERYAEHWLPAATKHRHAVLVCAGVVCVLSLIPVFGGMIPTEFSPPVNRGVVTVDLTLPAGTPLAKTDAAAARIGNALMENPAVKHVEASAGRAIDGSSAVFASNVAQLGIVLTDSNADGNDLIASVKGMTALAPSASLAGAGKGMGGTAPISYNVAGDPGVIDVAAGRIARALRENPYATDVRTSDAGLGPRVEITIDSGKARMLDIAPADAARTARIATGGDIAMKARLPSGLVNVVVRSDAAELGNVDALRRFTVRSGGLNLVPLGDIAHIDRSSEPIVIARENRERVVTVSANTLDGAPIGLVTTPITQKLRDPNFLPSGARIEPRGDIAQFLDTVTKMMAALGLSMIAVYAILAILYRSYVLPLVIMLTVPLASIGAFGTLFALNVLRAAFPHVELFASQTLNLYSMLGIVMLVGLVAKNGILLVEYAERAVRDGASAQLAMRNAARRRFRPILMTTFAMIAGMLPLALGHTIGAEYRKALGTVVIGGLSSSLLLTLFVVPVVYVAYAGSRKHRRDMRVLPAGETETAILKLPQKW
ncbi:MAG: efflux RND transporter permease subunit [Candidatus Baltobacteraceae bacterium]